MLSDHATTIAQAYGVGAPISEMIMVARGEQGRIWRVDTDAGAFAIKELIIRQTPADAVADVAYQEAVLATRAVPMPRPIRRWPARSLLMSLGIRFERTSGSICCRWIRGWTRR